MQVPFLGSLLGEVYIKLCQLNNTIDRQRFGVRTRLVRDDGSLESYRRGYGRGDGVGDGCACVPCDAVGPR
jgi:hypothetical protein